MTRGYLVFSDSCGERVYLRATKKTWGGALIYGLAKDPTKATWFGLKNAAFRCALKVESVISRSFDVVSVDDVVPRKSQPKPHHPPVTVPLADCV